MTNLHARAAHHRDRLPTRVLEHNRHAHSSAMTMNPDRTRATRATDLRGAPVPLMSTQDVAKLLGLKHRTLEDWRQRRMGPPYMKLVGVVRYNPVEVAAWLNEEKVTKR